MKTNNVLEVYMNDIWHFVFHTPEGTGVLMILCWLSGFITCSLLAKLKR